MRPEHHHVFAAAVADVIDARLNGESAPLKTILPYHLIERNSVRK